MQPLSAIDNFYLNQGEPHRSCLLALKDLILAPNPDITSVWKYGMPFFCYGGKMLCYLWFHKKFQQPDIGIVNGNKIEHMALIQEKRSRMKIMLIDSHKDLPVKTIHLILNQAIKYCCS